MQAIHAYRLNALIFMNVLPKLTEALFHILIIRISTNPDPYSKRVDYDFWGCENRIQCDHSDRISISFEFFEVGPEPDVDGNCR